MKASIVALALLMISAPLMAAPDAREIMRQFNERDDGKSSYSLSVIATCRYQQDKGKMRCVENPRVKVLEGVQKDFGKNGKDSRSVSIIVKPAAEQGIGFLQYDYDDPKHDSDQWMYLSALGKVKRLVSGDDDAPKSGTMFGSEIAYEDIERDHLDDYHYTLLREETFQGRDCWVIESKPTPERARKSNYSRGISWIDKERMIMLQAQLYDRTGRPYKHVLAYDVQKVDGYWTAMKLNINNLQSQRITTMKTDKLVMNRPVQDALFSLRTLTDGAFREQQLNQLRKGLE